MTTTKTTPSERTGQSPINRDFPDQQAWFKCCKDCAFRKDQGVYPGVPRVEDMVNHPDAAKTSEMFVTKYWDTPFTCQHRVASNINGRLQYIICAGYAAFYNRIFR